MSPYRGDKCGKLRNDLKLKASVLLLSPLDGAQPLSLTQTPLSPGGRPEEKQAFFTPLNPSSKAGFQREASAGDRAQNTAYLRKRGVAPADNGLHSGRRLRDFCCDRRAWRAERAEGATSPHTRSGRRHKRTAHPGNRTTGAGARGLRIASVPSSC